MYTYKAYNNCANENLEAFGNWMRTINNNGKKYSPLTISSYQTALKNATARLINIDKSNIKKDLFEYDNFNDFERATEVIRNSPNFEEVNVKTHGAYSAAIKKYGLYLRKKGKNINNTFNSIEDQERSREAIKSNINSEALNHLKKTCEHFKVDFTEFVEYYLSF